VVVDKVRAKSQTGKFPILETPEGFTLFEGLTIAKYLARQRPSFYGDTNLQSIYHNILINIYSCFD